VLENIRESIPSQWSARVAELRALGDVDLAKYLEETGRDLEDVYRGNRSWTGLREAAELPVAPSGEHDEAMLRACGRLLHVDDLERIEAWGRFARTVPNPAHLKERERRLLRMLLAFVMEQVLVTGETLRDAAERLRRHPRVMSEIESLMNPLAARIDHLLEPAAADIPLQVHARYTRIEILAAFGEGQGARVPTWQTGVWQAKTTSADLLAFTLDKTTGQFSPTTRYRDYAISRDRIHWESQAVTREESDTGRRYRHHEAMGSSIHVFARLHQDDRAFWYLGQARYLGHEGEQPMAITWELKHPLPGDLFARFAAAVA
jgi:hypothetical protein